MACSGDGGVQRQNVTFDGCLAPMDMSDPNLCVALDVHIYLFGSLFLILVIPACYALFQIIRDRGAKRKPTFIITINGLVIIFGLLRALSLFIDAYGVKGRVQTTVLTLLLADLPIPCLTSAFAIIQWTFLELLKVRRLNIALQNSKILVAIVTSHFVFIAAIDFMLFYVGKGVCFLMTICQAVNVLWGLILTFGFIYTTHKLIERDRTHRLTLKKTQYVFTNKGGTFRAKPHNTNGKNDTVKNNKSLGDGPKGIIKTVDGQNEIQIPLSPTESNKSVESTVSFELDPNEGSGQALQRGNERGSGISRPLRRLRNTLNSSLSKSQKQRIRKSYLTKVKNVGIFTTVIGIGLFAVSVYGIVAVYNPFDGAPKPDVWGWYAFQTMHRILELCFGSTMVYLSASQRQQSRN